MRLADNHTNFGEWARQNESIPAFEPPTTRVLHVDRQNCRSRLLREINDARTKFVDRTARVDLRSSRFTRRFCRVTAPPISTRAGQANLIENAPNYRINDSGDGIWPAIERRNGGQHNRPRLEQCHGVARVNQIPWCLAWNEN